MRCIMTTTIFSKHLLTKYIHYISRWYAFWILLIQPVISRYFRHQSFARPGSPRRWNLRLSDCGRPGGNGQCANRTCESFRSWIMVSFKELWFCWFDCSWKKDAILQFFSFFWDSPMFSGRISESSTAATARRWAWKIRPKGLTDSQPVSHLFHLPRIFSSSCFHPWWKCCNPMWVSHLKHCPGATGERQQRRSQQNIVVQLLKPPSTGSSTYAKPIVEASSGRYA